MKGGPKKQDTVCRKCRTGRATWRCLDCSNKKPVCVFCCRNAHKRDVFHRVEKWNGRYFQKGALWQVGIKLYLGHDGRPCPRSAAALTGLNEFKHGDKDDGGDIIGQIRTADQAGVIFRDSFLGRLLRTQVEIHSLPWLTPMVSIACQ